MCFNWQILNQEGRELSLEEIERFTKNIGDLPSLTLGGGEPFLRLDLPEICEIFFKNCGTKKISIPTNCLMPDLIVKQAQKILDKCDLKLKVVLSLDGVGEVHDRIRGVPGNFDKFLETHKKLNYLVQKYAGLQINVNTTISDKNESGILETIDFIDQHYEVGYHTFEVIRGSYNQGNIQPPSLEKYQELINKVLLKSKTLDRNKYHKLIYAYYHKLTIETLRRKKQLIPCRVSSFFPVVGAQGDIYNCELLPSVGNLRDNNYDFKKIWHSAASRKQRQDIVDKKCYCTHYCYQAQNILMSPWHFLKALFQDFV